MFLQVNGDGSLKLCERQDFSAFHIVSTDRLSLKNSAPFRAILIETDEDHFWLDAKKLVSLAGRESLGEWRDAFWEMLDKVEKYGFYDSKRGAVRAHCEILGEN